MKKFDINLMGKKIKMLREAKGLSQNDLAKQLNVKQSAISKYERGAVNISPEQIFQLAILFETSSDYLLGIVDYE